MERAVLRLQHESVPLISSVSGALERVALVNVQLVTFGAQRSTLTPEPR